MSNWFRVDILLYQYNILNILQVQSCSCQERIDEGRTYYMYHLFLQREQLKIYYLTNFQEKIHFFNTKYEISENSRFSYFLLCVG